MNIYRSVTQLVGNTPLLELTNFEKKHRLNAVLLAKLECFNPAGSAKDRVALAMVEDFERRGLLTADSVIIEPTSGNTGIGLASVATARGYRLIIVMPDSMSAERQNLMRAYGAELVLTPGAEGMAGAIRKAEELAEELPNAMIAGQFDNPANPQAHYETTGPEIWRDTEGKVDVFVSGFGTGGTVSGTGRYLKEQNPKVEVVCYEPEDCPVLTKGHGGAHKIQGVGGGFIPGNLDQQVLDQVMLVTNEQAMETAKEIARLEGLLVGISSGAAVYAARKLAEDPAYAGKTIVALLPDTGERYLSTGIYND